MSKRSSENKSSNLTKAQRIIVAEKLMDLGNLSVSILVFTQMTSETFNIKVALLGSGMLLFFYFYGIVLGKN